MVYGVFRMVMPILLGRIIHYSNLYHEEQIDEKLNNGTTSSQPTALALKSNFIENLLQLSNRQFVIFFSVLLGILTLLNILISHPYFMLKWRLGMRIRIALSRLIYEKSLKVTTETVQRTTVGRITNLVANDAARFDSVFIYSEFLYMSFLEAPVAMIFLYFYIRRYEQKYLTNCFILFSHYSADLHLVPLQLYCSIFLFKRQWQTFYPSCVQRLLA